MAFATSAMTLADYRVEAIAEIGYGSTAYADLDTGEAAEIDRLIKRGERTFWFHPPVDPPHVWSCLRDPGLLDLWGDIAVDTDVTVDTSGTTVTASEASFYDTMVGKTIIINSVSYVISSVTSSTIVVLTATAGTQSDKTFSIASDGTFRLPSEFESPEVASLAFTENAYMPDVQLIDERLVNQMRATQDQTGYPQFACIRWVASDGTAAQAQELVTWPEPDQYYGVALPYAVQPQVMSASTDYPRGGPEIADALLSVILAVIEEAKSGRRGDRWAEATQKCQIAAKRDRSRHNNFVAGFMRSDSGSMARSFDMKRLILPA